MQAYSSSIAARGVIFSNCGRSNSNTGAVSGGWRQLHKPQWFEAFKEVCTLARYCHQGGHLVLKYLDAQRCPLKSTSYSWMSLIEIDKMIVESKVFCALELNICFACRWNSRHWYTSLNLVNLSLQPGRRSWLKHEALLDSGLLSVFAIQRLTRHLSINHYISHRLEYRRQKFWPSSDLVYFMYIDYLQDCFEIFLYQNVKAWGDSCCSLCAMSQCWCYSRNEFHLWNSNSTTL